MIHAAIRHSRRVSMFVLLVSLALLSTDTLSADSVPVRHTEGLAHGFLALRTLEGKTIADGDLIQVAHGDRVTCRVVFRFRDGSVHDETAIFSQRGEFRLITDHLVQRGPAFQHPLEMSINTSSGQVTVETTLDGKEKLVTQHFTLPTDLANGLVLTLLKNIRPDKPETKLSIVAATPQPRLAKLAISLQAEEPFLVGSSSRKAEHYIIKVEIGGAAGLVAPLLGKQPPDTHVWILGGDAPAFVKSEGPLYFGGPVWRIELVSPAWPRLSDSKDDR